MHGYADTPEAMEGLGRSAALAASAGMVISLVGGLGAGKTHWTKGFVAGLGSVAEVTSPTFGLVHEYAGAVCLCITLIFYRLESAEELLALGWDEYLDAGAVVIAEWGDKFAEILPTGTCWRVFHVDADGRRRVSEEND